jgi:hypothetical protein
MGGSGGGGGIFTSRSNPERLRQETADEAQRARFATEVNGYLARVLADVNDRDVAKVADRLNEIREGLSDQGVELETLLFGGSVAKHTFVDGLSDVDSLVLLDIEGLSDASPHSARAELTKALRATLNQGEVADITEGDVAIRVEYRDGTSIDLIAAVRRGDRFVIPSEDGRNWRTIDPTAFAGRLTEANREQGAALVPTIKVAKAIIAELPEEQRLTGYHVEALAIQAFRTYKGPRNPAAMLQQFFEFSRSAVFHPMPDVTGQSSQLDDYLGEDHSRLRQRIGASLARIARTMESATVVSQWRELLGDGV